ncbi:putative porin [Pontibacter rugosus]|uniref:Porin n=1 Tax=Pontibacter rugosus TaxID=1745966 RepID=A0ABW3SR24_9BACT
MKRRISAFILAMFLLLLANGTAHAQIIDDSTRLLYSPKTTLQLYEQNVLEGNYAELPIDTSLNNIQNERYWYNDTTFYQHLGNVGTAATPMLFQMPNQIGVRLGKNIFDRYAYDPQRLNYYNTRSPYTHLYYVQGGIGEQVFEALHTRNITPRWNFGVAYQILSADQQIGPASQERRTRGLIDNQAVKAFSHYRSENEKYDLFFNYTFMKVEQIESGGIRPGENDFTQNDLDSYEEENVNLTQAANEESRNNLHLTHIYKIAKENLKVYHTLDYFRQRNEYTDNGIPAVLADSSSYIYPHFYYSRTRTEDATEYKQLENTFGLTGNNKLSFYKAYVKVRNANILYSAIDSLQGLSDSLLATGNVFKPISNKDKFNQVFIGGSIRLFYKDFAELIGNAEYQLAGDYRIKGMARVGGAYASLERVLFSPSLVQQYMLSNHFRWNNDFGNIVVDRIETGLNQKLGNRQYVKFNANYTNIKRWVYFNEKAEVARAGGNQRFWGANLSHNIYFGPLHFENFVSYTNTDEADKIRIPEWLWESKAYVEGALFKGALYTQLGIQGTINSDYYAYGYMPVTQQFFVQNGFNVQAYPVIDVFLNADIKTVNVFLKMSHVNYGMTEPVNFITPYYPGLRRSFVFGLQWRFFD